MPYKVGIVALQRTKIFGQILNADQGSPASPCHCRHLIRSRGGSSDPAILTGTASWPRQFVALQRGFEIQWRRAALYLCGIVGRINQAGHASYPAPSVWATTASCTKPPIRTSALYAGSRTETSFSSDGILAEDDTK